MNKLTIIGNLTKNPELRTTQSGINVCSFSVAVNRKTGGDSEVDYFNVSAWRGLADICAKYLEKGKKVCVVGRVSLHKWDGGASMEVTADDVEFLSPSKVDPQTGMKIVDPDGLPY